MRALPFLLLALTILSACGCSSEVPTKSVDEVMATFNGAILGCTASLTEDGSIDQANFAKESWVITKRTSHHNAEVREHALDSLPELKPWEYEATSWDSFQHVYPLSVTRWGKRADAGMFDTCNLNARVEDAKEVDDVLGKLTEKFERKADRQGVLPRGGDFLTPRFDKASTGYYWEMPKHDVYVTVGDSGHMRLEVVAMPDRSTLDEFSPDNPKNKVPS